jgi:hypothetical protein
VRNALRTLAEPVRRYARPAPQAPVTEVDRYAAARTLQAERLARIDLREHNQHYKEPLFARLESQGATAAQCDDPAFLEWTRKLQGWEEPVPPIYAYNRKLWEWAYIAEAVTQAGLLEPGRRALGFGVGTEPLPAIFASYGLSVLATDQPLETG